MSSAEDILNEALGEEEPAPGRTRLEIEIENERARRKAKAVLDAEDAPPLQWWSTSQLLDAPSPKPLITDFLYLDSLARMFGKPGCGKTFVSIDFAMSVAFGRTWFGHEVHQGRVVYVMAEGQAVNRDRIEANMTSYDVTRMQMDEVFIAVPHAVLLTPEAMDPFLSKVKEFGPVLVILDTKNAMMVGEENSATDAAVMRRALDLIRKAAEIKDALGCCVLLIDHTGWGDGDRGRGSSAVQAAMDTEIKVEKDDDDVTVTVTRDKAAAAGTTVDLALWPLEPAAVLRKGHGSAGSAEPEWTTYELPPDILSYSGPGAKHVPTMARYMACRVTSELGITRAGLFRELGIQASNGAARNAWDHLVVTKRIVKVAGSSGGVNGTYCWRSLRVAKASGDDSGGES